jgi:predicted ferric reductase
MKALQGNVRRAVQAVLICLSIATVTIPPLVVAASGTATISATWTALRIIALYALTVLFLNIMTGAFRPVLARIFKPRALYKIHNSTGVAGFTLALTHGVLVIVYGLWPGFSKLGPVALYILAATTFTILFRKFLKRSWRIIHRLNYAVFVVALIHAFQVGSELRDGAFLKTILFIYTALVAAGFVYRLQEMIRRYLKKAKNESTEPV